MPTFQHKDLAAGRWQTLTLMEQLGNIGSEIGRARNWHGKDEELFRDAVFRALELLDLTITDPRWKGRLKEMLRTREVICDAFADRKEYASTWEGLERYFFPFAFAARRERQNKPRLLDIHT